MSNLRRLCNSVCVVVILLLHVSDSKIVWNIFLIFRLNHRELRAVTAVAQVVVIVSDRNFIVCVFTESYGYNMKSS